MNLFPSDFGWPNAIAVALIFGFWGFYGPILSLFGKGSLNSQLHVVRMRWLTMHQSIEREHRVFDAILLGHISGSVSYFGSATLLVLAGLVGTLVNVNAIYTVVQELSFLAPMTSSLFVCSLASAVMSAAPARALRRRLRCAFRDLRWRNLAQPSCTHTASRGITRCDLFN